MRPRGAGGVPAVVPPGSLSLTSLTICLLLQATNGGGAFSDYSSSVPSTPSISQRELRIETIAASNTPTPIRKQSKRRSNIFTVSGTGSPGALGWVFSRGEGKGVGHGSLTARALPHGNQCCAGRRAGDAGVCACVGGTFCVCRDRGAAGCFRQSVRAWGSIWEQDITRTRRSVQGCTRVGVQCV